MQIVNIIDFFDNADSNKLVKINGFFNEYSPTDFGSYRGYHNELSVIVGNNEDVTVAEFKERLEAVIDDGFVGFKGGYHDVNLNTGLWIAHHGDASGICITDVRDEDCCVYLVCNKID